MRVSRKSEFTGKLISNNIESSEQVKERATRASAHNAWLDSARTGKRLFYFRIVKPFNARLANSWLAFSFSAEATVLVSST